MSISLEVSSGSVSVSYSTGTDSNGNPTKTQTSITPSIGLSLDGVGVNFAIPVVVPVTASAGLYTWSDPAAWSDAYVAVQGDVAILTFVDGVSSGNVSRSISQFKNSLVNFGPTNGSSLTIPIGDLDVFSIPVNFGISLLISYDVTIPSGARINLDQANVQLDGLTIENGGIFDTAFTGQTFTLASQHDITNRGTIEALNGGILALQSSVSNNGTIAADGNGSLLLLQAGIDSVGGVIEASTPGSEIDLSNATLHGTHLLGNGTIETIGGGNLLDGTGAPLVNDTDVVVNGSNSNLVLPRDNALLTPSLTLAGTIDNTGKIELEGYFYYNHDIFSYGWSYAVLEIGADVTLEGGGQVVLWDSSFAIGNVSYNYSGYNLIVGAATATTLTNVDNTISGGGKVGSSQLTLINESAGIIDATGPLTLDTGSNTIINAGLLEATASGSLMIQSSIDNSGIIEAVDGGEVILNGHVNNTGTMEAIGNGSRLTIRATVDNAAGSLFQTMGAGSRIDLDGATLTGTLRTAPDSFMETIGGGNLFDGTGTPLVNDTDVVVNGSNSNLLLPRDNALLTPSLTLAGTIDNTGKIELEGYFYYNHDIFSYGWSYAVLEIGADVTLEGGGQVVLWDSSFAIGNVSYNYSGYNLIVGAAAATTLTNVDNTVSGGGKIGSSQLTLINKTAGIIDATGSLTLDTGSNTIINAGLLEATASGSLMIQSSIDNGGTIEAVDGGTVIFNGRVNNTGTISGGFATGSGSTTVVNSGTITGSNGTAVEFGGDHNTLELGTTGRIDGIIVGSGTDTLELSGGGLASFDLSQIASGFVRLVKLDASVWTVTGGFVGAASVQAGALLIDGSTPGMTVEVESGATLGGHGTTGKVVVDAGGTLAPGNSAGIIHTGDLTFISGANFAVQIQGTTPGTGYDQVVVNGSISLGGANLDLTFLDGFVSHVGDSFLVIDNDGADAVTGQFAQGAYFATGGKVFSINYSGGDGNDVVVKEIAVVNNAPALTTAGNGMATTDFGSLIAQTRSVVVQADGKIVVDGYAQDVQQGGGYISELVRYNADGSIDTTFGIGGIVSSGPGFATGSGVAVQADGKIVTAGAVFGSSNHFALARYNSDGSFDTSFGTGGKVVTDFGTTVSLRPDDPAGWQDRACRRRRRRR